MSQEKEKKRKYLRACLELPWLHTFLCSQWRGAGGGGDYSDEKLKPSRNVLQLNLQENGRSPICKYMDIREGKAEHSIAAVRATYLCLLRGSRVPAHNGAGLAMHEWT